MSKFSHLGGYTIYTNIYATLSYFHMFYNFLKWFTNDPHITSHGFYSDNEKSPKS